MKKLKLIFAILMFVTGLGIAGYPIISNLLYERNATQVVENYDDTVEEMDQEEIDAAKEAAKNYNEQLQSAIIRDENGEGEGEGESYVDLTGVGESIGYITIPKIDAELPIYEGSSAEVLQKGVGHMEQSSYPVGGEGTHSVLTGHRGLPDAELFTRLDELEIGDKFYLHVLDEILAYQVEESARVSALLQYRRLMQSFRSMRGAAQKSFRKVSAIWNSPPILLEERGRTVS